MWTDGRTYGRTFFPSNIIRSTFGSRPKNKKKSNVHILIITRVQQRKLTINTTACSQFSETVSARSRMLSYGCKPRITGCRVSNFQMPYTTAVRTHVHYARIRIDLSVYYRQLGAPPRCGCVRGTETTHTSRTTPHRTSVPSFNARLGSQKGRAARLNK